MKHKIVFNHPKIGTFAWEIADKQANLMLFDSSDITMKGISPETKAAAMAGQARLSAHVEETIGSLLVLVAHALALGMRTKEHESTIRMIRALENARVFNYDELKRLDGTDVVKDGL